MELYIIALIGSFLHIFSKFLKAIKRKDYLFVVFLKKNLGQFIFAVISAVVLVYIFLIPLFETKDIDLYLQRIVVFGVAWSSSSILMNLTTLVKLITDKIIDKIKIKFDIHD